MRGGFRRAVGPSVCISEVDLASTNEQRSWVHEQIRLRHHLRDLLATAPLDPDAVRIVGLDVIEGEVESGGGEAA